MATILFLDNMDSFSYNLVDQFRCLGHNVQVFNNQCEVDFLVQKALSEPQTLLVLSPGPGTPQNAGNMLPLVRTLIGKVPILGICLGHQAIIEAFGGKIIHAKEILHGKVSLIEHNGQAMFAQLPNPLPVARYHSLVGTDIPADLVVNAHYQGDVMAVYHRSLPICGFQFHPESILTVQGAKLLAQSMAFLLQQP